MAPGRVLEREGQAFLPGGAAQPADPVLSGGVRGGVMVATLAAGRPGRLRLRHRDEAAAAQCLHLVVVRP